MTNLTVKLEKVRTIMADRDAAGALFSTTANFAWLTGGRDNHVGNTSDIGASSLLVTGDTVYFISNNIERPRVEDEEIGGLGFEIVEFPWHEKSPADAVAGIIGNAGLLTDTGAGGTENIDPEISRHRSCLDNEERALLREAGQIGSEAISAAARHLHAGMTEHQAAALMADLVMAAGAFPAVTLVGADERILKYRHPVPTDKAIDRCVMLVLCTRYRGLIASCTRIVLFAPVPDELRRKHDAVCRVDGTFILGSRPGVVIGDLFAKARAVYEATGFADEWKLHHQGGATGYGTREYLGKPGMTEEISVNQAFAWNPSITGTKSEGTVLVEESANTVVTETAHWPTIEVELDDGTITRPDILEVKRSFASPFPDVSLQAVIFDLDGVLVSTDHFHYTAWKSLADELGIPFDEEKNHQLRGVSRGDSLKIIYGDRPLPDGKTFQEQCDRKNARYVELIKTMTPDDVLPGSVELLAALRAAGIKVGIASASKNTPTVLECTGLDEYVDAVADGNAITASKPDPEVFLVAAARLRVKPWNCIGVEDADAGIESILRAGMPALGVGSQAREGHRHVASIAETTVDFYREMFESCTNAQACCLTSRASARPGCLQP